MLKFRVTYNNEKELNQAIKLLKENFEIISISKAYKNTRDNSKYKRIYIDLENK